MDEDISRVTFTLLDGSEKYLDGEDLKLWLSYFKDVTIIAEKQNIVFPWNKLNWKDTFEEIFY